MNKSLVSFSLLLAVGSANAAIIDSFTTGSEGVTTNSVTNLSYNAAAASVLGGTRFLGQKFTGGTNRDAAATVDASQGSFNVSTPFGSTTQSALAYGNIGTPATGSLNWAVLNGTDFSLSGDTIRLNFNGNEQPLAITIYAQNETGFTKYQKTVAGDQFTPFTVDFTSADITTVTGSGSLASFDGLGFFFQSSPSGDFDLKSIEVVPEPTTIAGLALGAVALMRRRNKK